MVLYYPLKLHCVINGEMARDHFKGNRKDMEEYCIGVWSSKHQLPEQIMKEVPIRMSYNIEFDLFEFKSCIMMSIDKDSEIIRK